MIGLLRVVIRLQVYRLYTSLVNTFTTTITVKKKIEFDYV